MSEAKELKPLPEKLPSTIEEFRSQRKLKHERTLNDMVEEFHLMLYEEDRYHQFLYATYDEQATEGSLGADNIMAALMIRERAAKVDANHPLKREKLATISKSLGVVLRRYGESRKERRNRVGDEMIPDNNGSES